MKGPEDSGGLYAGYGKGDESRVSVHASLGSGQELAPAAPENSGSGRGRALNRSANRALHAALVLLILLEPEQLKLVELRGVDHVFSGDGTGQMIGAVVPWIQQQLA